MTVSPPSSLPILPITCLKTAENHSTQEAFRGQTTIIDFWTTKCTRCPDALDKLDTMAASPKFEKVKFVSICCDKLDGAREIIEKPTEPRWQHVSHYYMEPSYKETAKRILGFKSVPFYVVLNENGQITQAGGPKQVDFDEIPGLVGPEVDDSKENEPAPSEKQVDGTAQSVAAERVFTLDEDF